ncbi:MAG: peptidylprolyl isomerase [Coraliomargarita sp.]
MSCKPQPEAESDPVVVTIGSRDFTVSQLQAMIDGLDARGARLPDSLDAFVEIFVERQVSVERALALGLDDDPELRRQYENLLIGRLQQHEMLEGNAQLQVEPAEVEALYQEQIASYTTPAKMRIALLQQPFSAHGGDSEAALDSLEEARLEAATLDAATRGFGKLAIRYSEEPHSRFKGGDVGWVQDGGALSRWPDAVLDAAFELEADRSISPVVMTEDAAYLVMRLDARPESRRELDASLFARLEQQLLSEQRALVTEQLKQERIASVPVKLDTTHFSKIHFQATADAHANARQLQPMPGN